MSIKILIPENHPLYSIVTELIQEQEAEELLQAEAEAEREGMAGTREPKQKPNQQMEYLDCIALDILHTIAGDKSVHPTDRILACNSILSHKHRAVDDV